MTQLIQKYNYPGIDRFKLGLCSCYNFNIISLKLYNSLINIDKQKDYIRVYKSADFKNPIMYYEELEIYNYMSEEVKKRCLDICLELHRILIYEMNKKKDIFDKLHNKHYLIHGAYNKHSQTIFMYNPQKLLDILINDMTKINHRLRCVKYHIKEIDEFPIEKLDNNFIIHTGFNNILKIKDKYYLTKSLQIIKRNEEYQINAYMHKNQECQEIEFNEISNIFFNNIICNIFNQELITQNKLEDIYYCKNFKKDLLKKIKKYDLELNDFIENDTRAKIRLISMIDNFIN